MIIALLWFLVYHCERGIPICRTWQYLHAIAAFHFFRHMSMPTSLHTNIFFSTIQFDNMQSWLPQFHDLFSLLSSEASDKPGHICMCHCCLATFVDHVSLVVMLQTGIFFSTVAYENMRSWLSLFFNLNIFACAIAVWQFLLTMFQWC